MLQHLNNDDLTDLSLHSDEQALKELRDAMKAQHQQSSERDEQFWDQQRRAIQKKIEMRRENVRTPRRLPALAWSVALLALASSLLWWRHEPVRGTQSARTKVPVQAQDQDSALLAEVQEELDRNGPASLEPVEMLTDEMTGTSVSDSKQSGQMKENNQ